MEEDFKLNECGHFSDRVGDSCRECISERNSSAIENILSKKQKTTKEHYSTEYRLVYQFDRFEDTVCKRNGLARSRIRKVGAIDESDIKSFSTGDIRTLLEEQDHCCKGCYSPFSEVVFQIDHKIPIEYGGNNNIKNLQLLCESCNHEKWRNSNEQWLSTVRYNQVMMYLQELQEEQSYGT